MESRLLSLGRGNTEWRRGVGILARAQAVEAATLSWSGVGIPKAVPRTSAWLLLQIVTRSRESLATRAFFITDYSGS